MISVPGKLATIGCNKAKFERFCPPQVLVIDVRFRRYLQLVESGCDDKTRFEQKTRETRTAVIGIMLFLARPVKSRHWCTIQLVG